MKINWKKALLWFVILIVWIGLISLANYITGQSYAKVAAGQFDTYTESYRILRTNNTVETLITVIGAAGVVFCIVKIFKGVSLKKS